MLRRLVTLMIAVLVAGCAGASGTPSPSTLASDGGGIPGSSPSALPSAAPAPTGSASARPFDATLAAALQSELADSVATLHFPALTAAVVLPDGSSWSGAAGYLDSTGKTSATSDSSFAIASVSKTFVAALMLELAQDGVLRLDDSIGRWLPELRSRPAFSADIVTIRQLLDHTSGIADYLTGELAAAAATAGPAKRWIPDELLAFVGTPTFAPGTNWAYSNTNYLLAGMIIERATGSSVASVLRTRILAPLGLRRTVLQPDETPAAPVAHGYSADPSVSATGGTVDPWDGSGLTPSGIIASAAWTAGGMVSTAPELARWASALYGGRVLSKASQAEMLDFSRTANLPAGGTYGLGVMRWFGDAGLVVGHAGGTIGFQSGMWYLTKPQIVIVVLTNTDEQPLDVVYLALERLVLDRASS